MGEEKHFMKILLDRVKSVIGPSLFLTFTFFVFGPLQLYMTNADEFWFSFLDVLGICVLSGLVVFLVCIGVGYVIPEKWKPYYICLLFGLALAMYIQGNYVFTDYGTLDGESINWSQYKGTAVWNSILWAVCIVLPFVLRKLISKIWTVICEYVPYGIIAVQLITLITVGLTMEAKPVELTLSNKNIFELSKNDNTIVFILDCYDSAVYQEFIEKHPEYAQTLLNEFTYYPDTVGGATRTHFALPFILTGVLYQQGESYVEYIDRAFEETRFYDRLSNNAYSIGLYTKNDFVSPKMVGSISNIIDEGMKVGSYPKLAYYLYRFTSFSYFPHILKKAVWMYSGDFANAVDTSISEDSAYTIDDAKFYDNLVETGLTATSEKNAFRLYHLMGAHGPYTLSAQSDRVSQGTSQDEQLMGVMHILETYFNQMKELGIYDSANIIVMADHGERNVEQNPLLLVKQGQKTQEYTVDSRPVSYINNLPPTLLELIGESTTAGKSISQLTDEDNQKRYFYRQTGQNNVLVLREYVIEGNAQDQKTCAETGKVIPLYATDESNGDGYQLGTQLFFDNRATAMPYIVSGFSGNEPTHTWSNENESVLQLKMEEDVESDLYVTFEFAFAIKDRMRVSVYANDTLIGNYRIEQKQLSFVVPQESMDDSELVLCIQYWDAMIPAEVIPGGDVRNLALAYYSMVIDTYNPDNDLYLSPSIDMEKVDLIDFSAEGNSEDYLGTGWHGQEAERRWTSPAAEMTLVFEKGVYNTIQIDANPYAPSGPTKVFLNGQELGVIESNGSHTFTIPNDVVQEGEWQTLSFETEQATSPKEAGESEDGRLLGVFVSQIQLLRSDEVSG